MPGWDHLCVVSSLRIVPLRLRITRLCVVAPPLKYCTPSKYPSDMPAKRKGKEPYSREARETSVCVCVCVGVWVWEGVWGGVWGCVSGQISNLGCQVQSIWKQTKG